MNLDNLEDNFKMLNMMASMLKRKLDSSFVDLIKEKNIKADFSQIAKLIDSLDTYELKDIRLNKNNDSGNLFNPTNNKKCTNVDIEKYFNNLSDLPNLKEPNHIDSTSKAADRNDLLKNSNKDTNRTTLSSNHYQNNYNQGDYMSKTNLSHNSLNNTKSGIDIINQGIFKEAFNAELDSKNFQDGKIINNILNNAIINNISFNNFYPSINIENSLESKDNNNNFYRNNADSNLFNHYYYSTNKNSSNLCFDSIKENNLLANCKSSPLLNNFFIEQYKEIYLKQNYLSFSNLNKDINNVLLGSMNTKLISEKLINNTNNNNTNINKNNKTNQTNITNNYTVNNNVKRLEGVSNYSRNKYSYRLIKKKQLKKKNQIEIDLYNAKYNINKNKNLKLCNTQIPKTQNNYKSSEFDIKKLIKEKTLFKLEKDAICNFPKIKKDSNNNSNTYLPLNSDLNVKTNNNSIYQKIKLNSLSSITHKINKSSPFIISKQEKIIPYQERYKEFNTRLDCLYKRIKTHLHKFVYNKINKILKLETIEKNIIFKLPKGFISDLGREHNKKLFNKTVKEIYSINLPELDKNILIHNKNVLNQTNDSTILNDFINKTFKDIYFEYLNSTDFTLDCSISINKDGKEYTKLFRKAAHSFYDYVYDDKNEKQFIFPNENEKENSQKQNPSISHKIKEEFEDNDDSEDDEYNKKEESYYLNCDEFSNNDKDNNCSIMDINIEDCKDF